MLPFDHQRHNQEHALQPELTLNQAAMQSFFIYSRQIDRLATYAQTLNPQHATLLFVAEAIGELNRLSGAVIDIAGSKRKAAGAVYDLNEHYEFAYGRNAIVVEEIHDVKGKAKKRTQAELIDTLFRTTTAQVLQRFNIHDLHAEGLDLSVPLTEVAWITPEVADRAIGNTRILLHDIGHIRGDVVSAIRTQESPERAFAALHALEATLPERVRDPYVTVTRTIGDAIDVLRDRYEEATGVTIPPQEFYEDRVRFSPNYFGQLVANAVWNWDRYTSSHRGNVQMEVVTEGEGVPYFVIRFINGDGNWPEHIQALNEDVFLDGEKDMRAADSNGIGLFTLAQVAGEHNLGTLVHRSVNNLAVLEFRMPLFGTARREN